MEDLINMLINSKLKDVEKATGIPYDRMYKWTIGKSTPKTEDYNKLQKYFNGINSSIRKSASSDENGFDNKKVTIENEPLGNSQNRDIGDFSFNDVKPINHKATYLTNSTFPEKPPNEMWELVNIQNRQIKQLIEQNNGAYQQINLLYSQIELLNNLLQKHHEKT